MKCFVQHVTLVLGFILLGTTTAQARDLSFEERVRAQESIERVYYSHQIGATRPFEDAVPLDLLEKKVRTYLKQSVALETFWKTPVDGGMLRAEMERIARRTRMPERLRELHAALGNDPVLIQECLARPALVDRLARNFFTYDDVLHPTTHKAAEALHGLLIAGRVDPWAGHPSRTVVDLVRIDSEKDAVRGGLVAAGDAGPNRAPDVIGVSPEDFEAWNARVPGEIGAIGPLLEEREQFVIRVVLDRRLGNLRFAEFAVAKQTWSDWWEKTADTLDESSIAAVSPAGTTATPGSSDQGCRFDDTWEFGSLDDVPESRRGHTAVWTGSLMLVWGASYLNTGGRYDPATDTWSPMSMANSPSSRSRWGHSAVWTGSVMVVWGGSSLDTGGRYDPVSDSWQPTSLTGAPSPREYHKAVWTGSVMVVWGGFWYDPVTEEFAHLDTGGRYDPVSDSWQPTSLVGAPSPREGHEAVWTGTVMVVWGGYWIRPVTYEYVYLDTGGRYDPVSDSWQPTSLFGAPSGRTSRAAVWTGSLMLVWDSGSGGPGGRYDPSTDAWTPIATTGAPAPRGGHTTVWTGGEMIVWGGQFSPANYTNTGGRYNPVADSWNTTSMTNAPLPRLRHTAIWTGSLMVVWGGHLGSSINSGGRYDPATDTWTPTATANLPQARIRHAAVWTGSEMIVWGGFPGAPSGTGARYNPATDTWTPTALTNAPFGRSLLTGVWTGTHMIVWGGIGLDPNTGNYGRSNTGGRYDPLTDTWSATSTIAAPAARKEHTAVWTGSRMIVWGGYPNITNAGGQYDPGSDTWTPTSTINAPSGRENHTAVWTGDVMIVWGGYSLAHYHNDGGRYDPAADTWAPTATTNAPAGRTRHSAVWADGLMLVWGGYDASGTNLSTGGRYDAATDAWGSTSLTGVPSPRSEHTAVWTGSYMVVWGGLWFGAGLVYLDTGARYDPISDAWTPTSTTNPPLARSQHTALWTGESMLVWGGGHHGTYLNDGGLYCVCTETTYYPDADGDGYGNPALPAAACVQFAGYVAVAGDCDDADPAVHPAAAETCNGRDDDCNGLVDEDAAGVDSDGDTVPNACDNCIFDPDPSQSDIDSDSEGDVCDLDDGLIMTDLPDTVSVAWQPEAGFKSFNVYRGDLSVLRQTGIYTQDPQTNPLVIRRCKIKRSLVLDGPVPPQGQAVFYLVTGNTGGLESSLGTNSEGVERPNDSPCLLRAACGSSIRVTHLPDPGFPAPPSHPARRSAPSPVVDQRD